jgi:hypothetical protein
LVADIDLDTVAVAREKIAVLRNHADLTEVGKAESRR